MRAGRVSVKVCCTPTGELPRTRRVARVWRGDSVNRLAALIGAAYLAGAESWAVRRPINACHSPAGPRWCSVARAGPPSGSPRPGHPRRHQVVPAAQGRYHAHDIPLPLTLALHPPNHAIATRAHPVARPRRDQCHREPQWTDCWASLVTVDSVRPTPSQGLSGFRPQEPGPGVRNRARGVLLVQHKDQR